MDSTPLSAKIIAELYGLDGELFQKQYKHKLSGFKAWSQKDHAEQYMVFEQNLSTSLAIDEVALSKGELYTVLTNKEAKGRKKSIVSTVQGTRSEEVISRLELLPLKQRLQVKEISLDMAGSMINIASAVFPKAVQIIDRFHVQKLANDAVQDVRIKFRWQAIDDENQAMQLARISNKKYLPEVFSNGDTKKQLLARSRHLLFKHQSNWTESQRERATILFEEYPRIEQAYKLSQTLFRIYQSKSSKEIARLRLAHWYNDIENSGFKQFNSVLNTIKLHYDKILNYFDKRTTNASAESFNAKIKEFRMQFRGVIDKPFFLYRLGQLYA